MYALMLKVFILIFSFSSVTSFAEAKLEKNACTKMGIHYLKGHFVSTGEHTIAGYQVYNEMGFEIRQRQDVMNPGRVIYMDITGYWKRTNKPVRNWNLSVTAFPEGSKCMYQYYWSDLKNDGIPYGFIKGNYTKIKSSGYQVYSTEFGIETFKRTNNPTQTEFLVD